MSVKLNLPNHNGRIIVLDGTGNKPEYDKLFQRDFELITANVELNGCRTVFLQQALGKVKSKKLDDKQIQNLLKKAIDHLNYSDKKVLIGTHKDIEENVKKISKQLMPDRHVESTHFWASRGVNKYQDFDTFIAFGTPTVNKISVLDEGMILFRDSNEREDWFAQMGTSDLIQTVHRIRPINGDKTIIILGREWPKELGIPDIHIDLRRGEQEKIKEAYKRLKRFVEDYGFITKEIARGLGIGCKREMERLEAYQVNIQDIIEKGYKEKFVPCLIKSILLDKEQTFRQGFKISPHSLIIFGRPSYWKTLISMLKKDFGNLPELKTKQGEIGGKPAIGLGYLDSVRQYYNAVSIDAPNKKVTVFHDEMWEGKNLATYRYRKNILIQKKSISKEMFPQIRSLSACPGFVCLNYKDSIHLFLNPYSGLKSIRRGLSSIGIF